MGLIPAPLYRDPIFDGAADPMIIFCEHDKHYYMFYTQRRANQQVVNVSFCYGTAIGVAKSKDGCDWHYVGALDLDFEFGHNTFWAPEVVCDDDSGLYHMFVTYIQGVYSEWKGTASLEHYTSDDLLNWHHEGGLQFGSERIIDPCIFKMSNGAWRMWYKDERRNASTCYADSSDLYNWSFGGISIDSIRQEGPNVFEFGGYYWMIADVWKGLAVYRSDDLDSFKRQDDNILSIPGIRTDDGAYGAHADVVTVNGRAFIVYFVHPEPYGACPCRSSVQMAELEVKDGILVCDRNALIITDWTVK